MARLRDGSLGAKTSIYINNDGTIARYAELQSGLPDAFAGSLAWVDFDRDGDLDAFLSGLGSDLAPLAGVYVNELGNVNQEPGAPDGLVADVASSSSVSLSWQPGTDVETPAAGLTYALRVGTAPGGSDVSSAMTVGAARQLAEPGPIRTNTGYSLHGLTWGATYYWSVQTIDSALGGSEMAFEQSFLFNNRPVAPVLLTPEVEENNLANEAVALVVSNDFDMASGDTLAYSLVAGVGDDDNASFQLVGNELVALEPFNFEQKKSYSIRVYVRDALGDFSEAELQINVVDVNEAPTEISISSTTVPENAPGIVVANLQTADEDQGQTHSYSIAANPSGVFEIVGDELRIRSSEFLDYESVTQHSVSILSTDSGVGSLSITQSFVIDVIDVNEVGVTLIDDVNKNSYESYPQDFTELDGVLYFSANVSKNPFGFGATRFLYRYDPATGTNDLASEVISPRNIVAAAGKLYMSGGYAGQNGIVEFDPSTGNTAVVSTAIMPSTQAPKEIDGKLYYWGHQDYSATGQELIEFDLVVGTTRVIEFVPGAGTSGFRDRFVEENGKLYFVWKNASTNWGVREYDPVSQSTRFFSLGNENLQPYDLTSLNSDIYFVNQKGNNNANSLWRLSLQNGGLRNIAPARSRGAAIAFGGGHCVRRPDCRWRRTPPL